MGVMFSSLCLSMPCFLGGVEVRGKAGSRTDKTAFAGLTWEFGGKIGYVPNLVLCCISSNRVATARSRGSACVSQPT